VLGAATRFPDQVALVPAGGGPAIRYGELADRLDRRAADLIAHGVAPGDVVALWGPNAPAWAETALAAQRAGAAVTGVSMLAVDREVAGQLCRSGASLVLAAPPLLDRARAVAGSAPVREVIALAEEPPSGGTPPRLGPVDPGRTALVPMSSGTSGRPKAVVLTHRNVTAGALQLAGGLGLTERDVVLALAPFPHIMGFVVTLSAPLLAGATVVTLPRFELPALLRAVSEHRVTVLAVPPPVLTALAASPQVEEYDLGSLEFIAAGGAPVAAQLQQRVARRFPGVVVGQGYGMTETSATIPVPDRRRGTPPGSVGRLAPDTSLRIVDPATGRDRGTGEPGELWVRGPGVTPGYLGDAEATAGLLTPDGWLRTGDLGYVDVQGDLHVVDRIKDLIKVNALQVAPAELEELLLGHPAVADAAVTGRPHSRRGEVPVAFVVARAPVDAGELTDWIAQRVAPHKRLAGVTFVEALPRSPAGKLARRSLPVTVGAAR
jgi:acyl-CoA synthetase (AMP-forming)/AMP-acid ligase II